MAVREPAAVEFTDNHMGVMGSEGEGAVANKRSSVHGGIMRRLVGGIPRTGYGGDQLGRGCW